MTPLHQFGELLRQTLGSIPLEWVRALFVGTLLIVLLWVLRLPKSATSPADNSPPRWDSNLKLSAGAALIIQIVIYSML